jgi:hypothetical protein
MPWVFFLARRAILPTIRGTAAGFQATTQEATMTSARMFGGARSRVISSAPRRAIDRVPEPVHSAEETRMRSAIAAWGHRRWPDYRCMHEVALSERRVDLVFVGIKDIVGIEIKSSRDRLDRLEDQVEEYRRWLPEVWVAVATRWQHHAALRLDRLNLVVVDDGPRGKPAILEQREGRRPYRDELVCSRMLGLLWRDEAARIAQRTGVIPGNSPTRDPRHKILPLLARLLTGNEIMREVCAELRQRPAVVSAAI